MRSIVYVLVLWIVGCGSPPAVDVSIPSAFAAPDSAFDQPHPPQLICEDSFGATLAPLMENNPRTEGHPQILREMRIIERGRHMIVVDVRDWDLDHNGGGYVHDRVLLEWAGSRWCPTRTMRRFD